MQGCNSYKQESPSHFNVMSWTQAPVGLAHRNTHRNECMLRFCLWKKFLKNINSNCAIILKVLCSLINLQNTFCERKK